MYDIPFHSLNLNVTIRFGEDKRSQLGFKAENLLGDNLEQNYESFGSQDKTFSRLNPGRTVTLKIGYSI